MTYFIVSLVVLGIAALIRGVIIPAYRGSQRNAAILAAEVELSIQAPPFALADGETVLASAVAQGMSALRVSARSGHTEDEYLAALPLVFVTSKRFVLLMATNDDPRGVRGPLTPMALSPDRRIGEMFPADGPGGVSAVELTWPLVFELTVMDPTISVDWEIGGGTGVVAIGLIKPDERAKVSDAILQALTAERSSRGLPAEPTVSRQPDMTSYNFQAPTGRCGNCGTPSKGDRFCTGCGAESWFFRVWEAWCRAES